MGAAAKYGHQRPQSGGEHHANPGERLSAAMARYFSSTQSVKRMKLGTSATRRSRGIMPARLRRAVAQGVSLARRHTWRVIELMSAALFAWSASELQQQRRFACGYPSRRLERARTEARHRDASAHESNGGAQ